jgi:tRNA-Thr(GGU) m(6)t(6)A37 methyltransferase TsaA
MALTPGLIVIGVVRSAYTEPADTPVQSRLNPDEAAVIEIDERYVDGLDGLAEFDFAWLLTWLGRPGDRPESVSLRQVPYLLSTRPRKMGIFATRGPRRVNPIGLSLIRVLGVVGSTVRFGGVDAVDGTPVIDIKPYVTAFDHPPTTPRCGWFEQVAMPMGATPASLGRPNSAM